MKRRVLVWVVRRIALAAGARGRRPSRGSVGVSAVSLIAMVAQQAEAFLARVWPWLDTPGNRARVERFLARMRSAAAARRA